MQLKLRRSQRQGGVLGKAVIFCLDARVAFTREEEENIRRYRLESECIYNSEASLRAQARGDENLAKGTVTGSLKAIGHYAIAHMRLNITINSLARGQHIECKSLDELLGAENAIYEACGTLRSYLDTAATFDGREVLIEFSEQGPETVAVATPQPALITATPTAASATGGAASALGAATVSSPGDAPVHDISLAPMQSPGAGEPDWQHTYAPENPVMYEAGRAVRRFFSEGEEGARQKLIILTVGGVLGLLLFLAAVA